MVENRVPDSSRRSERSRRAIHDAALGLVAEVGYPRTTIEAIAARAGVGKQTIYRWWSSKNDILMDAFVQDAAEALIPSDSADLRQDLRAHARNVAVFLTESDAGAVFRALTAQAQHDPALATRLRSEHLGKQRGYDRLPFERAVARGALDPGVDIDLAVDQIVGPIYYRVLVTGQATPPAFTDALVDAVLAHLPPPHTEA